MISSYQSALAVVGRRHFFVCGLFFLFRVSATFHMIWLSYYFGKVDLPFFFLLLSFLYINL